MTQFYLIGIKGAGMSALACLLKDYGHDVQGSDVLDYFFTEEGLKTRHIPMLPFAEQNIHKDYTVIVGNAFVLKNVEHFKAIELGCTCYTYYEYLGILSKTFHSIAISGSHGKTTTTNLIHQLLAPVNYLIGDGQGGGAIESPYFVFEACEYQRHFLNYTPNIAVITNLDFDHPDYYKDLSDVQEAFITFMNQSGQVVFNGDDLLLRKSIPQDKSCISYGINPENDYVAANISNDQQWTYFDLYYKLRYQCHISIPLFGLHSVYNTLAAIATVDPILHDLSHVKDVLALYEPSKRRFEEHVWMNQTIVSDYAHHPREIKAIIEAIHAKYPFKKIVVYFQPHTYTRTKTFLKEFAESLSLADHVYLREIFSSAREHEETISVKDLAALIKDCIVINDDSYKDAFISIKDGVILFMGAGDIDRSCASYLDYLKNK